MVFSTFPTMIAAVAENWAENDDDRELIRFMRQVRQDIHGLPQIHEDLPHMPVLIIISYIQFFVIIRERVDFWVIETKLRIISYEFALINAEN